MISKELLVEKLQGNSDKVSKHGYEEIYSKCLPEKLNILLEVGIAIDGTGQSSLNAWSEIYPDASIIGADNISEKLINSGNIKSYLVDQSNKESLDQFVKDWNQKADVIIDDGSHIPEHYILTFTKLFPLLKRNGVYFIEDIHDGENLEKTKEFFDSRKDVTLVYHSRTDTNCLDSRILEIRHK
jgi:hypothetical protein